MPKVKKLYECIDCNKPLTDDNRKGNRCKPCHSYDERVRQHKYQVERAIKAGKPIPKQREVIYGSKRKWDNCRDCNIPLTDDTRKLNRCIPCFKKKKVEYQQDHRDRLKSRKLSEDEILIQPIKRIELLDEKYDFQKEWLDDPTHTITTEFMRNVPIAVIEREYQRSIQDNDPIELQDKLKMILELLLRLDLMDDQITRLRKPYKERHLPIDVEYPY